ncbi:MAG TPA: phosphoribosyltransferase family protein, partial [Candidatus Limnocylindria bacterium]
ELRGRSVIIVDDGAATGATMLAALAALRLENPGELIVALPVAPPETCDRLRAAAERVICLQTPSLFFAIGTWYRNFDQVADYEVANLLREAADGVADTAAPEQLATS